MKGCFQTPDCQGHVPKDGEIRIVRAMNGSQLFPNDRTRDEVRGKGFEGSVF